MLLDELYETRVAYLYHGTNAESALRIIQDGGIEPRTSHTRAKLAIGSANDAVKGISLTRDFAFAKRWGQEVIFEFDQIKLRQRFRLAPVDFMSDYKGAADPEKRREEREEFLITSAMLPLENYLTRVYIDWNVYYDELDGDRRYYELLNHPLIKII